MKGWKTKAGFIVVIIGLILSGTGKAFPEYAYLIGLGENITAVGAAFMGYGLAHKVEKNGV